MILAELAVPKSGIPGGAVYDDGSFALAGMGMLDGTAEEFDFIVDGRRYTGRHTGLLAYRAGECAFATAGSVLHCDGDEVALENVNGE